MQIWADSTGACLLAEHTHCLLKIRMVQSPTAVKNTVSGRQVETFACGFGEQKALCQPEYIMGLEEPEIQLNIKYQSVSQRMNVLYFCPCKKQFQVFNQHTFI